MPLTRQRLDLPSELVDTIRSEHCVAFIGSGFSRCCYGSWPEIVNALCERCGSSSRVNSDSPPDALLDGAQHAKDTNEEQYYAFLGERFGQTVEQMPLIYNVALALPFRCYVTTNYDPLLALAGRTAKIPLEDENPWAFPSLDRQRTTCRSVHHLHGLIPEGATPVAKTIVLTRTEFDEAYASNSNLMNFLVPMLENDSIVFMGCRLEEPMMARAFSTSNANQQQRISAMNLQGEFGSRPPPRFILLPNPIVRTHLPEVPGASTEDVVAQEDDFLRSLKITPVRYPVSGEDHSGLRFALERLANLIPPKADPGWREGDHRG